MKNVNIGITHSFRTTISESQSAIHVGSGSVSVFGTPAMLALMEKASNLLIDPYFEEGETSVGIEVNIKHTRATAIGKQVEVFAELTEVKDNRILTFAIWAEDEQGEIGRGTLKRAVINIERFMARL